MNCREITDDMLLDYAGGELAQELQAKLKAHLAQCESCLARSQEISAISVAMMESQELNEDIPIPGRVDDAVSDTIRKIASDGRREARKTGVTRVLIRVAAGVCIIVIAGVLFIRGQADRRNVASAPDMMAKGEAEPEAPRKVSTEDRHGPSESKRDDAEIAAARREVENLTSRVTTLEQELATEREKTSLLTAALKAGDEDRKELREALVRVKEDYGNLKWQGDEMLAGLKRKVADMTGYVARLEDKIGDLLAQVDGMAQKDRDVRVEAIHAQNRLAILEREKADLERQLLVAGDINRDRKADAADAMLIVDRLLSEGSVEYSAEGDANGDGKIDIGDALIILNKALVE